MPLKNDNQTEYTEGGTSVNRGMLRRLNPMVFLTICCTLFVLIIVAALIIFTFLPIFTPAKGNQTKYQIQSEVLTLVYNLPDRLTILPINLTYVIDELEFDKLSILQKRLQRQLNDKKLTKKTSVTIMDAFIIHQNSSSTDSSIISPITMNHDNNSIIIITEPDGETKANSTTQLMISLILRYALECAKGCQKNLKESIFAKTFQSLELSIDDFRILLTEKLRTPIRKLLTSSLSSTTVSTPPIPCFVNTPSSIPASSIIMAINYEAESSLNSFISSTIQPCSVCSGKQKVGNIGFNGELIFQQVTSQHGGSTLVVFFYTTDRIRSAEIIVNDQFPSVNVTFPLISSHQNIGIVPITVNLCQGFNSIHIYNRNDYAPDFDRIVVY